MIYPLGDDNFCNKFILIVDKEITLSTLLDSGKVASGSYAAELISRIFDGLVTYSIDVQEEFEKYYRDEYKSLEDYLFGRYDVERHLTRQVLKTISGGQTIYYGDAYSGGDQIVAQLLNSDDTKEILNQLLAGKKK